MQGLISGTIKKKVKCWARELGTLSGVSSSNFGRKGKRAIATRGKMKSGGGRCPGQNVGGRCSIFLEQGVILGGGG